MKRLVFATNNKHKLAEVQAILMGRFEILSLSEIGCFDEIPETADTIEGNAEIKARWVKEKYGYDCFADDTGLEVESLGGAPGVFSARYACEGATFADNNRKLLEAMDGKANRNAAFRTVICLIMNDSIYNFEGRVDGLILEKSEGFEGFGYDPIFVPKGYSQTYAQMGISLKNKISHRAIATQKLMEFLSDYF